MRAREEREIWEEEVFFHSPEKNSWNANSSVLLRNWQVEEKGSSIKFKIIVAIQVVEMSRPPLCGQRGLIQN